LARLRQIDRGARRRRHDPGGARKRNDLAAHAWPGNVRELRIDVERCLVLRSTLPPGALPTAAPPAIDAGEPLKLARDRAIRVFEHGYSRS
jgi:DNA-binding NtrC family response regulator